ncbi:hypothetical protein SERLADRAFT_438923 [Serpula lacrymans var. lacrymans S7.9]|nr:uncharacterized protein SERLADRAFT_438923 [Serpula lacrymans var. lacrymans S7.9]EGO23608.1 hypothetical protein SERLADRAFT_438923 [Serpula lacrymans var. lacrymans S7.9]
MAFVEDIAPIASAACLMREFNAKNLMGFSKLTQASKRADVCFICPPHYVKSQSIKCPNNGARAFGSIHPATYNHDPAAALVRPARDLRNLLEPPPTRCSANAVPPLYGSAPKHDAPEMIQVGFTTQPKSPSASSGSGPLVVV